MYIEREHDFCENMGTTNNNHRINIKNNKPLRLKY